MEDTLIVKYLAGECEEEEKKQVELWIESSPINREEFRKIKNIWDASAAFVPDAVSAFKNIEKKIDAQGSSEISLARRVYQLAAAVLVLGVLGTGIYLLRQTIFGNSWQRISASDERKIFLLPDGSKVWLNKNSSMEYDIRNEGERLCKLQGEAFFEVTKMPERPFRIETQHTSVQVVGTSFNIQSSAGEEVLSVATGKVKYAEKGGEDKAVMVSAGEASVYAPVSHTFYFRELDVNAYAWKTGVLRFINKPLGEAAKELEKFYGVKIIVDKSVRQCLLNVTFDNLSLEDVMIIIQQTLKIEYTLHKNKVQIQGKGC